MNLVEREARLLSQSAPGFTTSDQNSLVVERYVVPIIFVPGIMGTRLRTRAGEKVWDPDDGGFMLKELGLATVSAAEKRDLLIGKEFDPHRLDVDDSDAIHNKKLLTEDDSTRANRGWGGVSWSSYGEILTQLQTKAWDPTVNLFFEFPVHAFGYNWTASNDLAGEKLATYIDEVIGHYHDKCGRKCEKIILVTHSMGGLVARAACKLHGAEGKVLGVIHGVQPSNGSPAAYWRMKAGFERPHTIPDIDRLMWLLNPVKMTKKVIKHKIDTITKAGISLSDIPFIPVPLPDMRFGKGNITAWVLGTDGEEVTALLGNMPGGLQLLPNKRYKNNNGWERWLELVDKKGERTALPVSDPYSEIYEAQDVYYRLVNPDWLNPGAAAEKESFERSDWKLYRKYLAEAKRFHEDRLKDLMHEETYQFYSSGIASADRVIFKKSEAGWLARIWTQVKTFVTDVPDKLKEDAVTFVIKAASGPAAIGGELIDTGKSMIFANIINDFDRMANKGGYRDKVGTNDIPTKENKDVQLVTLQLPDGAGDGTVPESSGGALKPGEDCKRTFCIADKSGFEANFVEKKAKRTKPKRDPDFDEGWFDRTHEPIYKTQSAQFITFTAIENICRKEIRRMLDDK